MKRTLTLLLALMLVIALFAGCGGNTTTPTSTPGANPTPGTTPGNTSTPAPTNAPVLVENGKEAIYDIEYNEYGIAAERLDYEAANVIPFEGTPNKPFTWWLTISESAMAFYSIDDVADLPAHKELRERTGVVMEYQIVASTAMATSFATMLASDDLTDLVTDPRQYYPNSMLTAVNEGYFANLYEYLEYMPCYQYTINNLDDIVWDTCYQYGDVMPFMVSTAESLYNTQGILLRSDFLSKIGMTAEDVRTVDEMYDCLKKMKAAGVEWPLALAPNGDLQYGGISAAFGTIGNIAAMQDGKVDVYVVDGVVKFPYCEDSLKEYIATISKWYTEGLVDPNWASNRYGGDILMSTLSTGKAGVMNLSISFASRVVANATDSDCALVGIPNLVKNRGDIHHMKWSTASYLAGFAPNIVNYGISADCENIPLLCSWCDYWFSDNGYMLAQFGIEGEAYTIDEDGQVWWTEVIYNNPYGLTIAGCWEIYATNSMGRRDVAKGNYYAGGIGNMAYVNNWERVENDKAWEWPNAVELSEEDENEFNAIYNDLSTLVAENYAKFITGEQSLSEWDTYVATCKRMKLDRAIEIYQNAYDDWMKNKTKRPGSEA